MSNDVETIAKILEARGGVEVAEFLCRSFGQRPRLGGGPLTMQELRKQLDAQASR